MRYIHPTQIPLSKTLKSLEWLGDRIPVSVPGIRGDTYPMTWGKDGHTYMGTGDPNWFWLDGQIVNGKIAGRPDLDTYVYQRTSGHVVEKLTGTPEQFSVERVNDMPGHTGWGGHGPKPSGMISVDGSLYYAVQNLLGWKPPRYGINSQHGSDASLFRSDDYGKTWTPDINDTLAAFYREEHTIGAWDDTRKAWKTPPPERTNANGWKPMFPGNWFGGPSFIQFGQDNEEAADDYVYAISADHWHNGSDLRLGRVSKDAIMDASRWEFAVPEDDGGVKWTDNLYRSLPVLAIERHISLPEMVYLPKIRKYILLTWGLHHDFRASTGAELTVLEADNPWGPFSLVYYEWMWGKREGGHYCPRIPLKWFNQDTLSGYLLYSGNWETITPYYMPQVRAFKFIHA
jgi:hypothetical protein